MCHHYLGAKRLPDWLVDEFELRRSLHLIDELSGSFYPTKPAPVIWSTGQRCGFSELEWGLLPRGWKPSKKFTTPKAKQRSTFNAKSETADTLWSFRNAFKSRRCLVPAQAFEEKEHYFSLDSGEMLCFAGLWDCWDDGEGGDTFSFTILTTEPNDAVQSVGHHRMPVLLTTLDDCRLWMNPDLRERAPLERLFEPYRGALEYRSIN